MMFSWDEFIKDCRGCRPLSWSRAFGYEGDGALSLGIAFLAWTGAWRLGKEESRAWDILEPGLTSRSIARQV